MKLNLKCSTVPAVVGFFIVFTLSGVGLASDTIKLGIAGPKDVSKNTLTVKAKKDHQKTYGEDPGAFFENAYAATLALLNAIEKAGSTDFDAMTNVLRTEFVDTPLGKIRFDERGDAIGVGFSMYQVKNREYIKK